MLDFSSVALVLDFFLSSHPFAPQAKFDFRQKTCYWDDCFSSTILRPDIFEPYSVGGSDVCLEGRSTTSKKLHQPKPQGAHQGPSGGRARPAETATPIRSLPRGPVHAGAKEGPRADTAEPLSSEDRWQLRVGFTAASPVSRFDG